MSRVGYNRLCLVTPIVNPPFVKVAGRTSLAALRLSLFEFPPSLSLFRKTIQNRINERATLPPLVARDYRRAYRVNVWRNDAVTMRGRRHYHGNAIKRGPSNFFSRLVQVGVEK